MLAILLCGIGLFWVLVAITNEDAGIAALIGFFGILLMLFWFGEIL